MTHRSWRDVRAQLVPEDQEAAAAESRALLAAWAEVDADPLRVEPCCEYGDWGHLGRCARFDIPDANETARWASVLAVIGLVALVVIALAAQGGNR